MIRLLTLACTLALLTACEDRSATPTTSSPPPAADNTGRNKVDRDAATKTPVDQSNTSADTRITGEIRKALVGDSTFSTNAQNCKIITEKGVVTLRGPVNSQSEKDAIEAKAKAVPGVLSVVNELEVKVS